MTTTGNIHGKGSQHAGKSKDKGPLRERREVLKKRAAELLREIQSERDTISDQRLEEIIREKENINKQLEESHGDAPHLSEKRKQLKDQAQQLAEEIMNEGKTISERRLDEIEQEKNMNPYTR